MKKLIITVFKGMGILTASSIMWSMTVGFYDATTNEAGVYPSAYNKAIYENALPVVSHRLFTDTDSSGAGYTQRTYDTFIEDVITSGVPMFTTKA